MLNDKQLEIAAELLKIRPREMGMFKMHALHGIHFYSFISNKALCGATCDIHETIGIYTSNSYTEHHTILREGFTCNDCLGLVLEYILENEVRKNNPRPCFWD